MNCSQIRNLLNDHVDGVLPEKTRVQIDDHLNDCPGCRQDHESLLSLTLEAGRLDSEIRPSRDLWPGIQTRIEETHVEKPLRWLRLAAAGMALAVLSVPVSVWWVARQDPEISTIAPAEIEDERVRTRAELARFEDGVLLARTDLLIAIERHRDVIDTDSVRIWEENMRLLDQAIGELRTALDEDPQNRRLRMLLASRYQQERKLLQKVSRV